MKPRALLFDVFGTCVDWFGGVVRELTPVRDRLNPEADIAGLALAWRQAYYDGMAEVSRGAAPFRRVDEIHRSALDELLPRFGLEQLTAGERDQLNTVWHRLEPWHDVPVALRELARSATIATLSNGNLDLLLDLSKRGELCWHMLFCSDLFGRYKPDPETYLQPCHWMNLEPGEVMLVACHLGDLQAAAAQGLQTAMVHRPAEYGHHRPADTAKPGEVDLVASDFLDLARQLEGLRA